MTKRDKRDATKPQARRSDLAKRKTGRPPAHSDSQIADILTLMGNQGLTLKEAAAMSQDTPRVLKKNQRFSSGGHGGRRPGAGRKKRVPNKANAAREAAVAASGLTPLEFMLAVMRDEKKPDDVRFEAAKAAAPYVHPRLASVEHAGAVNLTYTQSLQAVRDEMVRSGEYRDVGGVLVKVH